MPAWRLYRIDGEPLTIVHGSYEKAAAKADHISETMGWTINIVPSV
jgi:hypothetical protein